MATLAQNDSQRLTRLIEVTPGVVATSARGRVYNTGASMTAEGGENKSNLISGAGYDLDVRAGLRAAGVEIPSELVYLLNDKELEDVLRSTYIAEVAPVSTTFTFDQTGAHEDGSVGPTVVAAAGSFNAILATADFKGIFFNLTGAALHAQNRGDRVIKDIAADGSKIDVDPAYGSGTAGLFGGPLFDEAAKAGILSVGQWVRNGPPSAGRSVNFELDAMDLPGGSYWIVNGCRGNTYKEAFSGKGNVTRDFGYMGLDYTDEAATTVSIASEIANAAIDNSVINAANDLSFFAIGGGYVLSGLNLTQFSLDLTGNASGADDVSGTPTRVEVGLGDISVSGSLSIYHRATLTAALAAFGRQGTLKSIAWGYVDPAGNRLYRHIPYALLNRNAPKGGAKNSRTSSAINFMTRGTSTHKTIIFQQISAP